MKNKLSIVVLTHNDELRIVDCLESVRFADELIVIDDNSSDRTIDLIKQFTDRVYVRELNGNFSSQRNFALNHVHNEWVLFVDSDEIVSEKLKTEILDAINFNKFNGYFIKRIDLMWSKNILHGEAGEVKLLRLARNNFGKWKGKVHETWRISGDKGILRTPLIHIPHQSVQEFVSEIEEYSTLRSNELFETRKKISSLDLISYPVGKFILNYFAKKGFKDGIPGLLYAMLMSFHSFLVRGKLYLLRNSKS